MNFLEKDLETLIWDCLQKDRMILMERGLHISGTVLRQLNLGSYGIADLVSFSLHKNKIPCIDTERTLHVTVYELKKDEIGIEAFLQADGYCKGIERYIYKAALDITTIVFEIVLIGKTINKSSNFCYLTDCVSNLSVYTYNASIEEGFVFEKQNEFYSTSESFPTLGKTEKNKLKSILRAQSTRILNTYGQTIR